MGSLCHRHFCRCRCRKDITIQSKNIRFHNIFHRHFYRIYINISRSFGTRVDKRNLRQFSPVGKFILKKIVGCAKRCTIISIGSRLNLAYFFTVQFDCQSPSLVTAGSRGDSQHNFLPLYRSQIHSRQCQRAGTGQSRSTESDTFTHKSKIGICHILRIHIFRFTHFITCRQPIIRSTCYRHLRRRILLEVVAFQFKQRFALRRNIHGRKSRQKRIQHIRINNLHSSFQCRMHTIGRISLEQIKILCTHCIEKR